MHVAHALKAAGAQHMLVHWFLHGRFGVARWMGSWALPTGTGSAWALWPHRFALGGGPAVLMRVLVWLDRRIGTAGDRRHPKLCDKT